MQGLSVSGTGVLKHCDNPLHTIKKGGKTYYGCFICDSSWPFEQVEKILAQMQAAKDTKMHLRMKYFVLTPEKTNEFGLASRYALREYARRISTTHSELSNEILVWIDEIVKEKAKPA